MAQQATTGRHSARTPRRRWPARVALAAAALVVMAGAAIALAFAFGRPHVTVSASTQALVRVEVSGWNARVASVHATSGGQSIALTGSAAALVPATPVAQGDAVVVTASAQAPTWLRWLVGSGTSSTRTIRTPRATTSSAVLLGSTPGRMPVSFDGPVSVVDYRADGGPARVLRLAHPATEADLVVPSAIRAGFVQVAAAPRPWETVTPQARTMNWFVAPAGGGPIALAAPVPDSTTASSNGPITLTFAQPVATALGSARPTITPAVPGAWSELGPYTLRFSPSGFGFGPGTAVTVGFTRPVSLVGAGGLGDVTTAADTTAPSTTYHFTTSSGSLLRLEEILAQLHYLPLDFVPAAGVTLPTTFEGEVKTMSEALPGTFAWRWSSTPSVLEDEWKPGEDSELVKGALMSFISDHGTYDGYEVDPKTVPELLDPALWEKLLLAAAGNQVDPHPYSYVSVSKVLPETLTVWQDGSIILSTPTNTGIPGEGTADGTFPVYLRFVQNYMNGTNPDGSKYHDLVHWINYFNGSDAVHGFVRSRYGFPQSLGCAEIPVSTAATVFSELAIGDLVTVSG